MLYSAMTGICTVIDQALSGGVCRHLLAARAAGLLLRCSSPS
jgi:hypothetical protein